MIMVGTMISLEKVYFSGWNIIFMKYEENKINRIYSDIMRLVPVSRKLIGFASTKGINKQTNSKCNSERKKIKNPQYIKRNTTTSWYAIEIKNSPSDTNTTRYAVLMKDD
jgi:hypothetical protein